MGQKYQPSRGRPEDSDYNDVFELWISKLPKKFASSVNDEGVVLSGAIITKDDYVSAWRALFTNKAKNFPSPRTVEVEKTNKKTGEIETVRKKLAHPIFAQDVDSTEAKLKSNLFQLIKILEKSPYKKSEEIVNAMRRFYEVKDDKKERIRSKLLDELKGYYRLLESFINSALQLSADYDPETAEDDENPYEMSGENIGKIAAKLTKEDILKLEKIYEAKGGSQEEQRAYKFDFDALPVQQKKKRDDKGQPSRREGESDEEYRQRLDSGDFDMEDVQSDLKNLWDDLRVLLKQPVEYYTIKASEESTAEPHQKREEDAFIALAYFFNELGRGRIAQRFFREGTRYRLREEFKDKEGDKEGRLAALKRKFRGKSEEGKLGQLRRKKREQNPFKGEKQEDPKETRRISEEIEELKRLQREREGDGQ